MTAAPAVLLEIDCYRHEFIALTFLEHNITVGELKGRPQEICLQE